jgi:ribosomal protein S6--L-glutamate ligase
VIPLRIGFLLPRYGEPNHSHMPAVMRELSVRGVIVDVIQPLDRAVDLSAVCVEHDLYVLKRTNGLALSLAGALHAQGAAIVNPYPATVALNDKIVAARILQSAAIPTPATYVVDRPNCLASLLDEGPLVIKPYQGSEGYGVRVVRSVVDLAALPAGKQPVLAQRYHPPDGRDRKIYSIGGRLFGVKKIFPARTQEAKHGEPFTPSRELSEIALRCGRAFGIDLYGVDIIESDGKPYVVDMCSMPGFKGVPDAASYLASYFHAYAAAERANRERPPLESAPIERLSKAGLQ